MIEILQPIVGKDAEKFAKCFVPGVIELRTNQQGQKQAFVKDARKDTVSRECLRHPEFNDKVKLSRKRDHFICNMPSCFFWGGGGERDICSISSPYKYLPMISRSDFYWCDCSRFVVCGCSEVPDSAGRAGKTGSRRSRLCDRIVAKDFIATFAFCLDIFLFLFRCIK